MTTPSGRAFVGISGFDHKPCRGQFYPLELAAREWLAYASCDFNTIELNGTGLVPCAGPQRPYATQRGSGLRPHAALLRVRGEGDSRAHHLDYWNPLLTRLAARYEGQPPG